MSTARRTIEVAEEVASLLQAEGAKVAVIGAMALAAHGYVRRTDDFDLATATDPFGALRRVRDALSARGHEVELREPDMEDPLGGVLVVEAEGASPIEVVNFLNPFAPRRGRLGSEAVSTATPFEEGALPVVDLPHLIALKLYAGGPKSELDVLEVLACNPAADLVAVRQMCERFGLSDEWQRIESLRGFRG
ncbi:MAG: hypothetical protein U0441_09155 [Polyangiaceae bacterium]